MKKLMMLAAALSFTLLPLHAQDEPEADTRTEQSESTEPTQEEIKAQKKAEKAAKRRATQKKLRAKMKFKWQSSLKGALAAAKKANTTCLVLYSNPATCQYCVKLEQEVFNSKEFKSARGIGIGYRSTSPIEEFGLTNGMPMAVLVGPDGKAIGGTFGYNEGVTPESFIERMKNAQPDMDEEPKDESKAEAGEEGEEDAKDDGKKRKKAKKGKKAGKEESADEE